MTNRVGTALPVWMPGLLFACLSFFLQGSSSAGQGPVEMLQATTDQVLEVVRQDPTVLDSPGRVRALATELVLPHVDFVTLSRWVLGRHWRTATEQQREDFVDAFREMLLSSYLRAMTQYRDNEIIFEPLRSAAEDKVRVHAVITQPNGPPVHVIFSLHHPGEEWLIYDMVVEGVSLVATHRSSIAQEIRRGGIDGLIARLKERNSTRSGDAPETAGEQDAAATDPRKPVR